MRRRASKWLRRVEITLWMVGISLAGGVSGATWSRWDYQQQQERALFGGPAVVSPLAQSVPRSSYAPAPLPVLPAATANPNQPDRPLAATPPPSIVRKPSPRPAAYGRIEIPRLGLRAIIKEGGDDKTLARAVGLIPGSAHPGETGNTVLAAHRDTFFWPLREVEVNDRIRLVVPPNTYEYRVDSVRVVEPTETSVLQSKGVEELTLVTCYPFRWVGPAPERFVVSATRVN